MKRKISFKFTILHTFAFLMLIIFISMSATFYSKTTHIILQLAEQLTKASTDKIIEKTTNYLNVPAMQTVTISKLVQDRNIIENREAIWKYMWEQLMVMPQVQAFFVADETGNYVQVRREPEYATRYIDRFQDPPVEKWIFRNANYSINDRMTKMPKFDPRIRPWYVNTQATPDIYWTDVYIFTTAQTPGISATYPITGKEGKKIAVVCANSPLHSLSDFLSEQRVSPNGIVFIINEKDELVAHPDHSLTTRRDAASGKLRLSSMNELRETYIMDAYSHYKETGERKFTSATEGKKYLVNFVPFPKSFASKWQIVVIIPEKDLLGSVHDMLYQEMVIAFSILFLAIICIYLVTHQITLSINSLAKSTEKIKNFQLDAFTGVDSRFKEIHTMSTALITATQGLRSFKKYVPAELVQQLIQLGDQARLGGEREELTILFSDIEGFTSISEANEPEFIMAHLSKYLEAVTQDIMKKKGTIDKYIGDAVMAFWGAPQKLDNSPYLACRAALECQRSIERLNETWKQESKPVLPTRIGIHTGVTVVGNVGSKQRMNYTIIGDSVNLASRLESINKFYGTKIIISEDTWRHVADDFLCRPLDIVAVKGRAKGVRIYELVGERNGTVPDETLRFCETFENGFSAYLNKDWDRAAALFSGLKASFPADRSVDMYIERCMTYQKDGPLPDNWDGITILTEK